MQHMPQRRHAAVVKIWPAGPRAIQRRSDVAGGLTDIRALAKISKPALSISLTMSRRERIEPHAIRANFVNRYHFFRIAAAGAIRAMAIGADAIERHTPA